MNNSSLPAQQGLYDPRNEHDACGVGFVAHIKGQASHDRVSQGLQILENLTHRGAVGADPLGGRRRRYPDPGSRCFPAQGAVQRKIHAAARRRLRRRHAVPAARRQSARCLRKDHRRQDQGRRPDAAGLARCAGGQQRSRRKRESGRTGGAPGVHRTRQEDRRPGCFRAQAVRHPQDRRTCDQRAAQRTGQGFLCSLACPRAPWYTKACCWPTRSANTSSTCRTRIWSALSRWCTSASPPTPSPPGIWRIRSA